MSDFQEVPSRRGRKTYSVPLFGPWICDVAPNVMPGTQQEINQYLLRNALELVWEDA